MKKTFKALLLLSCVTLLAGCGGGGGGTSTTETTTTTTTTDVPPTPITEYEVKTVGWDFPGGTSFNNSPEELGKLKTKLDDNHDLISSLDIEKDDNYVGSANFGENKTEVGFVFGSKNSPGSLTINFSKKVRKIVVTCISYWQTYSDGAVYDKASILDIVVGSIVLKADCSQVTEGKPTEAKATYSDNNGFSAVTLQSETKANRVIVESIVFGY